MPAPAGLTGLIELGNARFRSWVEQTQSNLKSTKPPDTFTGVVEALASHKRLEGEINHNYSQQAGLRELRSGLLSLGQRVEPIDAILVQFQASMDELTTAAKDKRHTLEAAKKSLEKIEDARQREAKHQEKLLHSFSTSVTAAFALFGSTVDLAEFPVSTWPYDQLMEYSQLLPSLDESLTKHLTQVQRVEVMLFDAKVTDEVLSYVSENLKAELARFAQELRTQRKAVAVEIDRRERSPVSAIAPSTTFSPSRIDSPTHTDLKFVVTGPNRRSTSERPEESRFSFVERGSYMQTISERWSISKTHARSESNKHRAVEILIKEAEANKVEALQNYAAAICSAMPFFGNTTDFPKQIPSIHPRSKDPGPPRVDLTDFEQYINHLMDFVKEHGMQSENIFSEKGLESEQTVLDAFTKNPHGGLTVDLSKYSVHSVATALKRSLGAGDPLFPSTLFEPLLRIQNSAPFNKVQEIQDCLKPLPPSNRYCLSKLFHVITTVWGNQTETKMDARNIAHVFAPHLLKRAGDPGGLYQIMSDMKAMEALVTTLIEEAHSIFGEDVAEIVLPDAVNFAKWPNERLDAFVDSLDTSDSKLSETANKLWSDLERAHSKLVSLKVVDFLPLILSNVDANRAEYFAGQTRRRDWCAIEVERRGQHEDQERTREEKNAELEAMYVKQRAAVMEWLTKAETAVKEKSTLTPAESQALVTEVRLGRAEAVAILIAATDSAMDLQLKGSDWEAILDIKQRVDDVVEILSQKPTA